MGRRWIGRGGLLSLIRGKLPDFRVIIALICEANRFCSTSTGYLSTSYIFPHPHSDAAWKISVRKLHAWSLIHDSRIGELKYESMYSPAGGVAVGREYFRHWRARGGVVKELKGFEENC